MNISELRQKFEIPDDFEININQNGGNSMTFSSKGDRADVEIGLDDEILAMVAKIKMGLINPLLATYYFQKDLPEEYARYVNSFVGIVSPLLDAWEMKTIKKYAPELLEEELRDIAGIMKQFDEMKRQGLKNRDFGREKRIYISLWAMAHALEMTDIIKIDILYFFDNTENWDKYLRTMRELAVEEPDPYLLPKLPEAVKADFTVKVINKPYWHFEIRGTSND